VRAERLALAHEYSPAQWRDAIESLKQAISIMEV